MKSWYHKIYTKLFYNPILPISYNYSNLMPYPLKIRKHAPGFDFNAFAFASLLLYFCTLFLNNQILMAKKLVLNQWIDHTNLKSTATEADIIQLCNQAKQYKFATVCIEPCYVKLAKKILKASKVGVCTVIGFPLGVNTTPIKVAETKDAIKNGATEIDMVINVGHLKDKKYKLVQQDIAEVKKACGKKAILKVILENCYLTDEEKTIACKLAVEAKADFVKTSTGFGTHGATVADVALMKKEVGKKAKIKAAGGIRDKQTAEAMVNAGAHRIGASASIEIVTT